MARRIYISDVTRKILKIAGLLLVVYLIVAFVLLQLEKDGEGALITTYPQALWYTLVTVSTVGYGDLFPKTPLGHVAGGILIILSVGFISYVVSKFGELAAEHSHRKFLGMNGTDFTGHYIIIGWNDLSRTVIKEMLVSGFQVAALTKDEKDIAEMRSVFTDPKRFFVSFGLYQDEAAFDRLNISQAAGAVLLTGDDTTTLVTVLHLKQLNPTLKITAYITNSQLKRTIENAGVSYVLSPNEILGRLIASAAFEPDVSSFMEGILSSTMADDDMDLQEFHLRAGHQLVGKTCREANLLLIEETGSQLLSYSRKTNGSWAVMQGHVHDHLLQPDDYLILLANKTSAARLAEYLDSKHGRKE